MSDNNKTGKCEIVIVADMCQICMLTIKTDILIIGKGPTHGLVDTTVASYVEHTINFTET